MEERNNENIELKKAIEDVSKALERIGLSVMEFQTKNPLAGLCIDFWNGLCANDPRGTVEISFSGIKFLISKELTIKAAIEDISSQMLKEFHKEEITFSSEEIKFFELLMENIAKIGAKMSDMESKVGRHQGATFLVRIHTRLMEVSIFFFKLKEKFIDPANHRGGAIFESKNKRRFPECALKDVLNQAKLYSEEKLGLRKEIEEILVKETMFISDVNLRNFPSVLEYTSERIMRAIEKYMTSEYSSVHIGLFKKEHKPVDNFVRPGDILEVEAIEPFEQGEIALKYRFDLMESQKKREAKILK